MKKATRQAYIKGLQLRSTWYSLLFAATGKKRFFDKRIKAGILMLSLLNLLNCKNQTTEKPTVERAFTPPTKKDTAQVKAATKERKQKKIESAIIDDLSVTCYEVAAIPVNSLDSVASCYIEIELPPEFSKPNNYSKDTIYTVVEEMPEFPGGMDALKQYLSERAIYPNSLQDNQLTGTVFVKMIVNTKGEVVEPTIIKGFIPEADSTALQIVRQMPLWKPGMHKGKPVNTYFTVPVTFSYKVKK